MANKSKYRDEIFRLHAEGLNYHQISVALGCAPSMPQYYLRAGQKEVVKANNQKNRHTRHPFGARVANFKWRKFHIPRTKAQIQNFDQELYRKVWQFSRDRKTRKAGPPMFTVQDVIQKFGDNPTCYLTGRPINIYDTRSYQFDHKIPVAKGGDNSLDNLGICVKQVNMAKSDMTPDEFYQLCLEVIAHRAASS